MPKAKPEPATKSKDNDNKENVDACTSNQENDEKEKKKTKPRKSKKTDEATQPLTETKTNKETESNSQQAGKQRRKIPERSKVKDSSKVKSKEIKRERLNSSNEETETKDYKRKANETFEIEKDVQDEVMDDTAEISASAGKKGKKKLKQPKPKTNSKDNKKDVTESEVKADEESVFVTDEEAKEISGKPTKTAARKRKPSKSKSDDKKKVKKEKEDSVCEASEYEHLQCDPVALTVPSGKEEKKAKTAKTSAKVRKPKESKSKSESKEEEDVEKVQETKKSKIAKRTSIPTLKPTKSTKDKSKTADHDEEDNIEIKRSKIFKRTSIPTRTSLGAAVVSKTSDENEKVDGEDRCVVGKKENSKECLKNKNKLPVLSNKRKSVRFSGIPPDSIESYRSEMNKAKDDRAENETPIVVETLTKGDNSKETTEQDGKCSEEFNENTADGNLLKTNSASVVVDTESIVLSVPDNTDNIDSGDNETEDLNSTFTVSCENLSSKNVQKSLDQDVEKLDKNVQETESIFKQNLTQTMQDAPKMREQLETRDQVVTGKKQAVDDKHESEMSTTDQSRNYVIELENRVQKLEQRVKHLETSEQRVKHLEAENEQTHKDMLIVQNTSDEVIEMLATILSTNQTLMQKIYSMEDNNVKNKKDKPLTIKLEDGDHICHNTEIDILWERSRQQTQMIRKLHNELDKVRISTRNYSDKILE